MKKVFLIDGDNNINLGLRGIEMLTEDSYVMIFHSKAMEITKFKKKLAGCRAHIDFIESVRSGKNSLDFQITTELGFLSHNKDLESAFIISCDKGYDAAVDYVKSRYSSKFKELDRKESIFDTFQLAFVLKAKTASELSNALVKEYGSEHGTMVFNHLQSLFDTAVPAATDPAAEETKAAEEKFTAKAEKKVKEVHGRVKKTVAKAHPKAKDVTEPKEMIFSADEILVEDIPNEEPKEALNESPKPERKAGRDRRKTRPDRKPKAASVHTKKVQEQTGEAAATVVVEKVEAVKNHDLPLRFGNVRTDEQNQSYYKSRDLRKKTKPQAEVMKTEETMDHTPAEPKVETKHVDTVVELVNENRKEENRKSSNRNRGGERRPRRADGDGKVVPMKPKKEEVRPQEKSAEAKVPAKPETTKPAAVKSEAAAVTKEAPKAASKTAPVKKASGQNSGFFGRMFGKKKK